MTDSVSTIVLDIIARQIGVPVSQINPERVFGEMDIDSLGMVEALFALEQKFDLRIPIGLGEGQPSFDQMTIRDVERLILDLRKDLSK